MSYDDDDDDATAGEWVSTSAIDTAKEAVGGFC